MHSPNIMKRFMLHLCLIGTTAFSVPMYISFIAIDTYGMVTYSFHKLEPAFLIAAFSITINDWSSVLYDIREINKQPLILRKFSLVVINVVFAAGSLLNFFICILSTNLDSFTNSPIYIIMIIVQLCAEILLTSMLLHAGIRLSRRIHGVSGILNVALRPSSTVVNPSLQDSGFDSALNRLIAVMAVCTTCILFQVRTTFVRCYCSPLFLCVVCRPYCYS
jgi:hypothetical protein